MTLAERIARVQAELNDPGWTCYVHWVRMTRTAHACPDCVRVLGRDPRPAIALSPFTRRALRGELPAKGLSR